MIEVYILSNVVEQGLQTRAVVFDMKGQFDIHQTIGLTALKQFILDNHDVRDEEVNGPTNCYSPWDETPATLSDYLSEKTTSQRIGTRRAQISLIRDPMRNVKTPFCLRLKGPADVYASAVLRW